VSKKARQYKPSTIRKLDTLSGNQCAAPECTKRLFARDGETLISKICHIEAASKEGPRFNKKMTDDERRHFNNLILLCDECHQIIDNKENEHKYPASLLRTWKTDHESKQIRSLTSNYSLLTFVIDAIAGATFDDVTVANPHPTRPFGIDDKLNYNAIKRSKPLFEEYRAYYSKLSSLYEELEQHGSFTKERLLRNIKTLYLKVKGSYVKNSKNSIQIVRKHADDIIEDIEEDKSATTQL